MIKNDINLACYHLPLDAHPKIGNNISLIKLLSCNFTKPFGKHKNKYIGFIGEYKRTKSINEIEKIIKTKINKNSLILKFGKEKIKTVAVISGSASSYFQEAILQGIDLFITGEPKEEIYYLAKDSQTNFIAAGHTHTEIFGIKNLQNIIVQKFKLNTYYLDIKNPL